MRIQPGCKIKFHCTLKNKEGEALEDEEHTLTFDPGQGDLPDAVEDAMMGKAAGEEVRLCLPPEECFGSYDLEAIITVPRSEFPSDAEIVPGDIVPIHLVPESADEEGGDLEARVIQINPEAIVLDANHPWAGQDIHFEIEIVSVDPGDDS